jgi:serine protease AprX
MADRPANPSGQSAPRGERLPIKLILPKQGKERRVQGGGNAPKPFRTVTPAYRQALSNQVAAIKQGLADPIARVGAAPVRVKVIPKAAAKSHRPEHLFTDTTCPIIDAGGPGELFVKATPHGLDQLQALILHNTSACMVKELSCVEIIEPITPSFRRRGLKPHDVLKRSPRSDHGFSGRVRLFNFGEDPVQLGLVREFEQSCRDLKLPINRAGYSDASFVYGVQFANEDQVEALSSLVSVRSVAGMPLVRTLRPSNLNPRPLPPLATRDQIDGDVPVVVVVDSGISEQAEALNSWVVGRESHVAPSYRNPSHGTFVAGLVCHGAELNPQLPGIDASPCAVFDLQLIPNDNPQVGDTDAVEEQEFLISLEDALQAHANEYKVWNLSLGTDAVCQMDEFSEFAEELDNLQEKYRVSFVISAGNYTTAPLLEFPRSAGQLDAGRITTPADSVLAIAVGSVSHMDYQNKGPKAHEPSSFSRHGAGPNHIIKPDLVHYGGTCAIDGNHAAGVCSISAAGTAEDLGTSFAAPLVSRTLAQIYHQITPTPSPVLARALLTHHARDPRTGQRVPDGEEDFFGFGLPAPVPYCLECSPYSSTLVFEDILRPGFYLDWDDFPYPPSLKRDGRYFGQVAMTVAFAPSRGARWGSEYCETHIDAHFGVYHEVIKRDTGEIQHKFKGLVPAEHKNPGKLFESFQVQHLRKWAPVRTYFGDMGDTGERGDRWRMKVQLLTRHHIDDLSAYKGQPFALIVTITDPTRRVEVYDEMARILSTRFQAQNLAVRAAPRLRRST